MPLYATNVQTGERVQFNGSEWVPVPPMLGDQGGTPMDTMGNNPALAFLASASQRLQRAGARIGNLALPGEPIPAPETDPRNARDFPVATAMGQAAPYAVPIPGGFLANVAGGAAMGGLLEDNPTQGSLMGGASSAIGYGVGSMAGRVGAGIRQAFKKATRSLPSGIRQTTGEALGNPQVMALEESMARNAITGRPFIRQTDLNKRVVSAKIMRFLGQEGDQLTETAVGQAWSDAVENIRTAVPDDALIPMPDEVQAAIKRFNALPDEVLDTPAGAVLTGKEFRSARSDILGLTRSPKASVRDRAQATLELMDNAAEASGTIDPALYREGRRQYRMWKTLTATGVTKPGVDGKSLDFNPTALDRSLGKSFGQQTTQGGQSTGMPEVDDLIAAVRDFRRTRTFEGGSVTTRGLTIPALAADLATTGGLGTVAAMAGSELSQVAPMTQFIAGASLPQRPAGEATAAALRALLAEKRNQK